MINKLKDANTITNVKNSFILNQGVLNPKIDTTIFENQIATITKNRIFVFNLDNGFGRNIMDPRVCTNFPTVKAALKELLTTLEE